MSHLSLPRCLTLVRNGGELLHVALFKRCIIATALQRGGGRLQSIWRRLASEWMPSRCLAVPLLIAFRGSRDGLASKTG